MELKSLMINQTDEWKALESHWEAMSEVHLRHLFEKDAKRHERFSVDACDWHLDYSKNLIDEEALKRLIALAKAANLTKWAERLIGGDRLNATEGRAVLHMALRNLGYRNYAYEGKDIMPVVRSVLSRMRTFSDDVRNGRWLSYTGQVFTDVVNIGIGGSSLGPKIVCEALRPYQRDNLRVHFVSNVDSSHIEQVLKPLDPKTTLFIISSKTFATQETLANATAAREWCVKGVGTAKAVESHFVAVSTNTQAVREFGINPANMFQFWDWVGGRYSLWSSIGLPIAIAVGMDNFESMLLGGHDMDEHFVKTPYENNMPVIMALLGIWYTNFGDADSYAIVPYYQDLASFPDFLQQLDMESNGKRITLDGHLVDYQTGPVTWGSVGTDAQHSFFQLIHQGTRLVPTDFVLPLTGHNAKPDHQDKLVANCLAQAQALMRGRTAAEVQAEMEQAGFDQQKIDQLLPHRMFPGNRPSNMLVTDKLTPRSLGALIALYEHKVFVQGIIWGVGSFDQWGVELGKHLANQILDDFNEASGSCELDSSTADLIQRYNDAKNQSN
jgi:glucose-6-phosphate isomerase